MNEDNEICDDIDLVQLLEHDEDFLQDELKLRTAKENSFDNIFDDLSIPGKSFDFGDEVASKPEPMIQEFQVHSKSDQDRAAKTNNHCSPKTLQSSQAVPSLQGDTWPAPNLGTNQYSKEPVTTTTSALLDPQSFERHFADRRNNLCKSMHQSALSRAHIDHIIHKKASRRHSMNSVECSRKNLQASFVGGNPNVNHHLPSQRSRTVDMNHRPAYQGVNFVQNAPNVNFVQHPTSYANSMENTNINRFNSNESRHTGPTRHLFRQSSWHGDYTSVSPQHVQSGIPHSHPHANQIGAHPNLKPTNMNNLNVRQGIPFSHPPHPSYYRKQHSL